MDCFLSSFFAWHNKTRTFKTWAAPTRQLFLGSIDHFSILVETGETLHGEHHRGAPKRGAARRKREAGVRMSPVGSVEAMELGWRSLEVI